MSYHTEFPDFTDLPTPIPSGFEDNSWHNDVMPKWQNEDKGLIIWVDYADEERREYKGFKRFVVCGMDADGFITGDLLSTDDWPEVVSFVEAK